MNYWMFNGTDGHASIQNTKGSQDSEHDGVIYYRIKSQKERYDIGDEFTCVIDNLESSFENEKIKLLNKGYINKTYEPKKIKSKDLTLKESREVKYNREKKGKTISFYLHRTDFSQANPFKKHIYLDDYSYSLLKVYKRYIKPIRHFSKIVTEINEKDFNTLKNENIFFSRTIFGRLINSLPYANRLQFMLYCLEEFKTNDLRLINYSNATPMLKKFIKEGLLNMGQYMIESINIVNNNSKLFGDYQNIGFIDENDLISTTNEKDKLIEKMDDLYTQSKLFEELFNYNSDFDSLFNEDNFKMNSLVLDEFEKAFNKRPWPVDLNTDSL